MPVKELAREVKTTPEKPRGRIRIQLDTPPKKPRKVRNRLAVDRKFWSNVFLCIGWVGVAFVFPGTLLTAILATLLGSNPDAWVFSVGVSGLVIWPVGIMLSNLFD